MSIIEFAENGVAEMGANVSCRPELCKPCSRVELLVQLVRGSVVDIRYANALKNVDLSFPASLNPAFTSLPRQGTVPVVRTLRAGFIYVYYPDTGCWDVWRVFEGGQTVLFLRQVSVSAFALHAVKQSTVPVACSLGATNLPAQLISIYDARNQSSVRIAFADHLWTPDVLKGYMGDNPAQRLLEFPVASWVNGGGGAAPAGTMLLNEANLSTGVVEFAQTFVGLRRAFEGAPVPLNMQRIGLAGAMAQTVRGIEKAAHPNFLNKALIAFLEDPKGVADAHNAIRMTVLGEQQQWMAGGADVSRRNTDPDRAWKRQSTLHIGYVRQWARDHARAIIEPRLRKRIARPHIPPLSREDFDIIMANGGYPPDTTWEPIRKPDGQPTGLGRIVFGKAHIENVVRVGSHATSRAERYLKKIKQKELEDFNTKYAQQQAAWTQHLIQVDTDHVAYLKQPIVQRCLDQDFDQCKAVQDAARPRAQVDRDLAEAAAKLAAVEALLGGGAVTEVSLKFLIEQFRKSETDPAHWIAQAIVGEFDLKKVLASSDGGAGLRADLYDAWSAKRTSWSELAQGWQLYRHSAQTYTDNLALVARQVTDQMTALAADAERASKLGISVGVAEAAHKRGVWVQAGALMEFLDTGHKHYIVGVLWPVGSFIDANVEAMRAAAGARLTDTEDLTGKQRQRKYKNLRQQFRAFEQHPAYKADMTVYVVLDEEALRRSREVRSGRLLPVVSAGPTGLPQAGVVSLPESVAKQLITEQRVAWAQAAANARANKRVVGSGAAVLGLQVWAFGASLKEFSKQAGAKRAEALASMLSAVTGMAGAVFEVGAMALAPAATTSAGTPVAGTAAGQVPLSVYMRTAAGYMMAGGAILDSLSAGANFVDRLKKHDRDAAIAYGIQGAFQFAGGSLIGWGSFIAYRSAVLNRLAVQGAVRIGFTVFGATAVASGAAAMATGIGLVLWIAGVGISVIAKAMEDDENEDFLERTFFGIGGKESDKFQSLEQEFLALGRLAFGVRAEIEWNDKWFSDDELTVNIYAAGWDGTRTVTYALEGYDEVKGRPLGVIYSGNVGALQGEEDGVATLSQKHTVKISGVKAVRLNYALWEKGSDKPIAQDTLWVDDTIF